MRKYRIKVTTYESGRKEYTPQVKVFSFFKWEYYRFVNHKGETFWMYSGSYSMVEAAQENINLHKRCNNKIKSISFINS